MPTEVEQIGNCSMGTQESLSLPNYFELSHAPFSHSGSFMRLLGPIILILLSTVDCLRNQFSVSNTIAAQLIGYDLPGLVAMTAQ